MLASPQQRAYSLQECARSIGIGRSTLYELIKQGKGPRVVKIGRRSLILSEDFETWSQSLATAA